MSPSPPATVSSRFFAIPAPERWGLSLLLAAAVAFGGVVELRAALLSRRMTDLDVYLRAAWAVRVGTDIYDVTDDNGWHYQYPPLFAILLTPLADPPDGVGRAGTLPFAVSVALWYVFSVLCLAFAVDRFATVLEEGLLGPAAARRLRGGRRWCYLRSVPVLACLVPICQTLIRGQVTLLLLALLAGMLFEMHRGRSVRAGFWLAGAICLKVIPALLLLFPLWRRDGRCLAGCVLGLLVGLGVVPAAVFGPARTLAYYREYDLKVLRPGMGHDQDGSRAEELMRVTATDSQSLQALIHNTTYLDRATRPADASPTVRLAHWLVGGGLLGVTLLAAGRRLPPGGPAPVLFLGALLFHMLLLSPVCHLHYLCLLTPLVAGLVAARWERHPAPGLGRLGVLLSVNFVMGLLPVLPGMNVLRDLGLAMYGAALLWLAGCITLQQQHARSKPTGGGPWAPAPALSGSQRP